MDESFQELESELKALKLRGPSAGLRLRIERELTTPAPDSTRYATATNLRSWKWRGWAVAGLAAAGAFLAMIGGLRTKQPVSAEVVPPPLQAVAQPETAAPVEVVRPNRYQPVAATNVLYDLKDEGPVLVGGEAPARRLRYRYLDTYTWKSSRGNASLKWSVPRDEIRVLPASMN